MTHPPLDTLPRPQRAAVESAGYRTARWSQARRVLDRRIEKQRLPKALSEFLHRWGRETPPDTLPGDLRLSFGVNSDRLFLRAGSALAERPLERALLHLPALKAFWHQELRAEHCAALLSLVPKAWIRDPAAIPPGAVIHGLKTADWPAAGAPGLHQSGALLTEVLAADLTFDAIYHLNEKGRIVLRSIEAAS
jgi:hypothetical protein